MRTRVRPHSKQGGQPRSTPLADFAPWIHRVIHLDAGHDGMSLDGWWQDLTFGLLTCEDGTAVVHRGRHRFRLGPGEAALLDPGRVVELSPGFQGIEVDHELLWFERSLRLTDHGRVRPQLPLQKPQPSWQSVFDCPNPVLVPAALRLETLSLARHLAYSYGRNLTAFLDANHRLTGWILEFHRHAMAVGDVSDEEPPFARRVEHLIATGLREGITVTRLAEIVGMSRAGLDRRYRRERGLGVAAAIDAERLRQACELLREWSYGERIGTTARRMGFSDGSAFARWFRKRTGSTPSEWRRAHRW